MRKERFPRDLHEQLGNLLRDGPKAGGESAGEDGDRKIGKHGKLGKWETGNKLSTFGFSVNRREDG